MSTPPEQGLWPTPKQLLDRIFNSSEDDQIDLCARIIQGLQRADRCEDRDHQGQIDLQRQQLNAYLKQYGPLRAGSRRPVKEGAHDGRS